MIRKTIRKRQMKVSMSKYFSTGQRVKVQIDPWDSWNADRTLALIIHPILIQLKATKHGWAIIDDSDGFEFEKNGIYGESRWNIILDEMIWAFEQIIIDDDEQFFIGSIEDGYDKQGYEEYHKRIKRGTTLFGKYFRNLWD